MTLFYQPDLSLDTPVLPPDESRHCVKVLRRQAGDAIEVVDGRGTYYAGTITQADPKQCSFSITRSWSESDRPYTIRLIIAPTKNLDRTEWLVEKAVEIGVDRISFVRCEHSERRVLKTDRLLKKAVAAMKQSGRARLPRLDELQPLSRCLASSAESATLQRMMAYVDPDNPAHLAQVARPGAPYEVLVGPEGGFSDQEVEQARAAGFQLVSLGPYRLRTETAGLTVCATLQSINVS